MRDARFYNISSPSLSLSLSHTLQTYSLFFSFLFFLSVNERTTLCVFIYILDLEKRKMQDIRVLQNKREKSFRGWSGKNQFSAITSLFFSFFPLRNK